jgi:hypothetical protein
MPTLFVAGQILRASQLNAIIPGSSFSGTDLTQRTTTSAGYTETLTPAGLCGVSFTGPVSGIVRIDWKGDISNSGATGVNAISIAVRTGSVVGSGTVVIAADDNYALRNDTTTSLATAGVFHVLSGLTAGTVYNVSLSQRCGAGTLTVARREVTVTQIVQ